MRAMQADKFGGYADLRLVDVVKPAAAEGRLENGTYCESVSVRKQNLCLVPENILPVEAAGLPVAYATAYLALRAAGFEAGKTVLAPAIEARHFLNDQPRKDGSSICTLTVSVARTHQF